MLWLSKKMIAKTGDPVSGIYFFLILFLGPSKCWVNLIFEVGNMGLSYYVWQLMLTRVLTFKQHESKYLAANLPLYACMETFARGNALNLFNSV